MHEKRSANPTFGSQPAPQTSSQSALDGTPFLAALQSAFQQAAQTQPTNRRRDYTVGGYPIQLQFASAALAAAMTSALAHVTAASRADAALVVYLWDSASTGVPLPPLPPAWQRPSNHDGLWGVHIQTPTLRAFWQPTLRVLTVWDKTRNQAFYWVDNAADLPLTEGSAPLLTLWHWWLGERQCQIVHGAAVGTATGAALLVGKSGSGKSTTALACLDAGLLYLGDDYCLISQIQQPTVYSLYSSGKVHFADLDRFPRFQASRTQRQYSDAGKALYFFAEQFSTQLMPCLPIKAILLPTVGPGQTTTFTPITPAAALLAIAPNTAFQLVGTKTQTVQQISQLVRQLPCYQLKLGTDLLRVPAVIAELLAA